MRRPLGSALPVAVLLLAAAAGADEGIHIKAHRPTSFMWTTQDAMGYRWDVSSNGTISDGTNDAYDGGLQLQVQGATFPSFSAGRLSKQRLEVEIGPWRHAGLAISRRIFVNVKGGYCRWIDLFENPTTSPVNVTVRYYSNMGEGTQRVHTSSGKAHLAKGDWGAVTAGASPSSSRPATVHVFASKGAKFMPRFQYSSGSDNLYYHARLTVPARKAVALCLFEAQRRPYDAAVKFLKEFKHSAELKRVPRPLRKILLNMGSQGLQVGAVEVIRTEEADLVVLRTGDEIRGTLTNPDYALATEFGEMKFPARRVIALAALPGAGQQTFIILADGQVVAGRLTSGPVKVTLAGGSPLEVPASSIVQAAYRICPDKPEEITPARAMVELRSGPRLGFEHAGRRFAFLTPHGRIQLTGEHLRAIEMDTPAGGLHRAIFRNRSVLAGLLAEEQISLKLKLTPAVELSRQRVKRLILSARPAGHDHLAALTCRNADVLYGNFADAAWTVRSKFGDVKVAPGDIAHAEFSEDSLGQVTVTLRTGTKIGGKLAAEYVGFKIDPGPELKIHVGHVRSAEGAPPPRKPVPPAKKPAPPPKISAPAAGKDRLMLVKPKIIIQREHEERGFPR